MDYYDQVFFYYGTCDIIEPEDISTLEKNDVTDEFCGMFNVIDDDKQAYHGNDNHVHICDCYDYYDFCLMCMCFI